MAAAAARPSCGGLSGGPDGVRARPFLLAAMLRCLVAAPSKLQRPSGDRVKTDARDELLLARLLRLREGGRSRLSSRRPPETWRGSVRTSAAT